MTRRILVIDDEADIREITELTLSRIAGWTVAAAADGASGAELAATSRPEAILLDVMMPGFDGEATARRLRADASTRDIPVVLLSAATELPGWAGELGVAGLIGKPFNPLELPDRLRVLLGWPPD